jgi:hypothetical protein
MMGELLYQLGRRLGTIFLNQIAIWATRPQHLTFISSYLPILRFAVQALTHYATRLRGYGGQVVESRLLRLLL